MSGKVLLVSVLLIGIVSQSSCRSLGEISEHKTYYSTPQYGGGSGMPSYGSGGGYEPTPSYGTTPSALDMHDFTGTCDYWKNHPEAIIACIGSLGSVAGSFGDVCSNILGQKLETLHDALCNTRSDGYGDLLREGTASYLNSIVVKKFAYTKHEVKECMAVAMSSEAAAVAQAEAFKKANECHYKY